jgi:hypothetical protein
VNQLGVAARKAYEPAYLLSRGHVLIYLLSSFLPDLVPRRAPTPMKKGPTVSPYCPTMLGGEVRVEWNPSHHAPMKKEPRSAPDPRPPSFNTCHDKE